MDPFQSIDPFHYSTQDFQEQMYLPKLSVRPDSCPPSPALDYNFQSDAQFLGNMEIEQPELPNAEKFDLFHDLNSSTSKIPASNYEVKKNGEVTPKINVTEYKAQRGRPRKINTRNDALPPERIKEIRAEKNRKFAKESRDRKRKYIEDLKNEIEKLKTEVEYYKIRLSKYELIDKKRISFMDEFRETVFAIYNEMREKQLDMTSKDMFMKMLEKSFDKEIEERKKALEQLARTMVEVIMLPTTRISLWINETHMNVFDPENIVEIMKPELNLDQAKVFSDYMKSMYPNEKEQKDITSFFLDSGNRVRSLVKQILECVRKAQIEIQKVGFYRKKEVLRKRAINLVEASKLLSVSYNISKRPDISDYAIYNIKEQDFRSDSSITTLEDNENEGVINN